jgi:hypothetical protein
MSRAHITLDLQQICLPPTLSYHRQEQQKRKQFHQKHSATIWWHLLVLCRLHLYARSQWLLPNCYGYEPELVEHLRSSPLLATKRSHH